VLPVRRTEPFAAHCQEIKTKTRQEVRLQLPKSNNRLLFKMRYDLAFFLCCCKSFLHSSTQNSTDYYELLGVDKDATQEDVKRAYKTQSLKMHPDKLAQRGRKVTEEDQARFQKMKEAYEVSIFHECLDSVFMSNAYAIDRNTYTCIPCSTRDS